MLNALQLNDLNTFHFSDIKFILMVNNLLMCKIVRLSYAIVYSELIMNTLTMVIVKLASLHATMKSRPCTFSSLTDINC